MNYVTENRLVTLAADLYDSINIENASFWGHYDPVENPAGTTPEGWHPGGWKRLHRHWTGRADHFTRPGEARRSLGRQRVLRGVYAVDVPAGPGLEPAEPGQPVQGGRAEHPGRALRAGNGGGRPHPLRHFRAPSVEAVPHPGDQPELLGLQRRGLRLFRRSGDCGPRPQGGGSLSWKWPGPTSLWRTAANSPIRTPRRRPRGCTSSGTLTPAGPSRATSSSKGRLPPSTWSMSCLAWSRTA